MLDDLNPPCQLLGTLEILNIDCIGDGNVTEEGFRTSLPPEISQQAWARFQRYASYVRIVQGLVNQSNSSLWIALASRIGDQPLFPCLRSIKLRLDDASCTKMLCLMAPSISSLTIFTNPHDDDNQNLDTILKAVSTISPTAVWTLRTSSPSLFRHTDFSCFSALRKVEVTFSTDAPDLFQNFPALTIRITSSSAMRLE
ncbi:hypothetical protein A0H81_05065 [Grifola frondosa]|uniref:Uncharacterized protein n=1 Tax=Grifola frondosa TaxID=5627 RepID=A0A1C7MEZ8_GRIFR|nr:hypothetical protein A0H81_05065 [Grifola frondosa]